MNQNERAEYLAQTYADAILRLSYSYLKNTHDAQDICQSVFVKLLTEPREFDSPSHERAYVLRMAANACKDLLKSPGQGDRTRPDPRAPAPRPGHRPVPGAGGPVTWRPVRRSPPRRRRTARCLRQSTACPPTTGQ